MLNVRHIAATPVGMKVAAEAKIVRIENRTVFLEVSARDEIALTGDGTHERVVVNVEKFSQRVKRKLAT